MEDRKRFSLINPESIIRELPPEEITILIQEKVGEQNILWQEILESIQNIPDLSKYDEVQQMIFALLKDHKNIELCSRYFETREFIQLLTKVGREKQIEQKMLVTHSDYLTVDEIKELIKQKSIIEVIEKYVGLPSNYRKLKNIRCPFPWHDDKTGSFHIYHHSNSFYCY